MFRKLLLAKIHGATVTAADLEYEGSLTLPPELLRASGIVPYESLHVWNVTRGSRLETYAIEGRAGSGDVCANGAAAHHIYPGDRIAQLELVRENNSLKLANISKTREIGAQNEDVFVFDLKPIWFA